MARIRNTSPVQRIKNTSPVLPPVDPELVARELGADSVGSIPSSANPMTLHALRAAILERRRSSGGRPALEGTVRRQKIPITEQQWDQLETLTHLVRAAGTNISPGQVASQLLDLALQQMTSSTQSAIEAGVLSGTRRSTKISR